MNIWRAAELLIDQHSADAPIRAAQRADEWRAAGGWARVAGAGDGCVRVRWRDPGARYATFVDGHLFAVEPGGELVVEGHEARQLERKGWLRA